VERYRRQRSRAADSARLFTVDRTARGRRRTLGLHGASGAWIVVGLVFLSATGLTWSNHAGANITDLRSALSWTTPAVDTDLTGPAGHSDDQHAGHAGHGTSGTAAITEAVDVRQIDGVLAVARANDITGAVEASIPTSSDTAFTVAQLRDPWVFSTDSIAVDGASERIVDVQRFADWPVAAKLSTWGVSLHMGVLFGLVSQLALLALAAVLVTMIIAGYRMWFQRRPVRSGASPVGRPPQRGAIQRIPPLAAVGVVVVTVAVGYFMPLLGLSLLGFLAVDLVVGVRSRAVSGDTPPRSG
jgi:uncharacterized iron-regulated membrane protein